MQIILLQSVYNLGKVGDVVSVKDGYARNFLIPLKKALYATEGNKKYYEEVKGELNKTEQQNKEKASILKQKADGTYVTIIERAGDDGFLYGSVNSSSIAKQLEKALKLENFDRKQIHLHSPIKQLGIFEVEVSFHAEVISKLFVNVAQSEEEAKMQKQGHKA